MEKTTIQIDTNTLERLKALKRFERESYDEILNVIIDDYEDDAISNEEITEIQQILEEVKQGDTYSLDSVAKELGVKLN